MLNTETQNLVNQALDMFSKYGWTEFDSNLSEDENHFTIENPNKEFGYPAITSAVYETYDYDEDLNETVIPAKRWFTIDGYGGRGALVQVETLDELLKEFLKLNLK